MSRYTMSDAFDKNDPADLAWEAGYEDGMNGRKWNPPRDFYSQYAAGRRAGNSERELSFE